MKLETLKKNIGNQISSKRKERNLSQEALGSLIQSNQSNVAKHEAGRYNETIGTLLAFAEALGCDLEINFRDKVSKKTKRHTQNMILENQ